MTRRTSGAGRRWVWYALVYVGALLLAVATGAAIAVAIGAAVSHDDRRIAPVGPSTPAGTPPAGYEEETSETQ